MRPTLAQTAPAMAALLAAACSAPAQSTWYVDGSCGDDAWTGQSAACQAPDGPKRTVKAGIDAAGEGDTVLVAPGVYTGIGNSQLYIETPAITLRSAAGPLQTIMDGTGVDTSWASVEYADGVVIDGFTVQRFDNDIAALEIESLVVIANCRFIENHNSFGGAILNHEVAPHGLTRVVNCEFIRNSATGAGGIFHKSYDMDLEVVNCTFVGCEGVLAGAVLSISNVTFNNCIFRGPAPQLVGNGVGHPVSYSNIEGEWGYGITDGGGNIDADPVFADPGADDYRLAPGSPCIDAADNTAVPDGFTTDLAGQPRFADDPDTADTGIGPPPVVDMGAHEFQAQDCYPDFTGDGLLDLFDFLAFVNAFNAHDPAADCVSDGTFDLFDFLCFVNAFNAGC